MLINGRCGTRSPFKALVVLMAVALASTVCVSGSAAQSRQGKNVERSTAVVADEAVTVAPVGQDLGICTTGGVLMAGRAGTPVGRVEASRDTKTPTLDAGSVLDGSGVLNGGGLSGGDQCPPPPPPAPTDFTHVIQLGDSYSSGVGALTADPPFEFGQHVCANPQYFRDEITPGIRLAHDLDAEAIFAGCSGAIAGLDYPGLALVDQVQRLVDAGVPAATNGGTDTLIVYSIGGNDLQIDGESWVVGLITCLLSVDDCRVRPTQPDLDAMAALAEAAHRAVINAFPNATIRVMGYPLLANRADGAPCEIGPLVVEGVNFGITLTDAHADEIDLTNVEMNDALAGAVVTVANSTSVDIEFVHHADESHPGACQVDSADEHVAGYDLTGSDISQNSFHPTEVGYEAMYEALAVNLGLAPLPMVDPPVPSLTCVGASISKAADPWGSRLPAGLGIRTFSADEVLNGTLLTNDVQTIDVFIDMLGAPVGTANITVHVEAGGQAPVPVTLAPYCYEGQDGSDRGFYVGTATLRTNDPFTSVVAQLHDGTGDLLASAYSGVASVERIESENTLETFGLRLNDSALDALGELAEFQLEPLMEQALRATSPAVWVADVGGLDVQFSPLAPSGSMPNGGLRAQVVIDTLKIVLRGDEGCNRLLTQRVPLSATVDLGFDSASSSVPLSVDNVVIGFQGLDVDISNAATQNVQICGNWVLDQVGDLILDIANPRLDALFTMANATDDFWLAPINQALGALMDVQIDQLDSPVTAAVTLGALQGDAQGMYLSVAATLPGGPVPDDSPDQSISTSLTRATAQGDPFDISAFVEIAALNRVLALLTGPINIRAAEDMTIPVDYDGDGTVEVLSLAFSAASYLTRGPDGTACAGLCAEAQIAPLRVAVFEPVSATQFVWDRDLLLSMDAPFSVTAITQLPDQSFELAWDTNVGVAGSVLKSADGSSVLGALPQAAWDQIAQTVISTLLTDLVPSPGEIAGAAPGLSASRRDVVGNTDLQVLLDLNVTPPQVALELCDGFAPTIFGTPNDDVIYGTDGNDVIHGLGGNDLIEGLGGNDRICGGTGQSLLDGGPGDDRLFTSVLDDFVRGGADDDVAWTSAGDDFIIGDGGKDWLDGAGGDDTIWGQDGSDTGLIGGEGDDTIEGGSGDDVIDGGPGHDHLIGGSNFETFSVDRDSIRGGSGDDIIDGGDRNDDIWGEEGDDTIDGGAGDDDIWGGPDDDTIRGGPDSVFVTDTDNDEIWGDEGNDVIRGGANADRLEGGTGNDTIYGGNKADEIWGGAGNDTLFGNDGWDDIWGGTGTDTGYGGSGNDWCSSDVESQNSC